MDEGVIKYTCTWLEENAGIPAPLLDQLNQYREKLKTANLLGVQADGIGFGNISLREPGSKEFWITGSQTAHLETLQADDISRVICFNLQRNHLTCQGKTIASSEAMSHGALYSSRDEISAVVHIHSQELWANPLKDYHFTSKDIAYGTVEMALELKRIASSASLPAVVVMRGHEVGVIGFGESLDDIVSNF